ncbi:MAG: hypothetical protein ACYDGM_09470 [Vulcanimicrobiaceae bacterium]
MKYVLLFFAMMLVASVASLGIARANEAHEGNICGHVLAPPSVTQAYATALSQPGIVIARSGSTQVQTTIGYDGSYCFKDLPTDLFRLSAFGDGGYTAAVTPIAGKTVHVDLRPASH